MLEFGSATIFAPTENKKILHGWLRTQTNDSFPGDANADNKIVWEYDYDVEMPARDPRKWRTDLDVPVRSMYMMDASRYSTVVYTKSYVVYSSAR